MINENAIEKNGTSEGVPKSKQELRKESRKNFAKGVTKLARYMKVYWSSLLLAVLVTIAAAVCLILTPSWMHRMTNVIIDAVFIQQFAEYALGVNLTVAVALNYIFKYGMILAILYGAYAILDYFQTLIMVRINNRVAMDLRGRISKKINTIPLSYYDKNTVGDVLSRTTNDVERIGETLTWSFTPLISNIVIITGSLIAMFYHSWVLALTALATIPVALVIFGLVAGFGQKYFKQQADYLGKISGMVEENFAGQVIVKAFNGQDKSAEAFSEINEKHFKASVGVQLVQGAMFPMINFIAMLGFIAVCIVGGILHLRPVADPLHVSIGMIVAFTLYIGMFQQAIGTIGESIAGVMPGIAASARVFEFLEEEEQTNESDKGYPLTEENFRGRIEFKNVRFGYLPDKTVIHDFSAVIEPGQKVAIVGPTGAGKTTMVNLLMRFYELDSGQILIDGIDIATMRRESVRELFGMVLQDTWIFEGSFKENIRYNMEHVTDEQIFEVCKANGIDHFIRGLPQGYDMILDDEVNIAGGQRQILTIARAMLQNSPCLILDEATSNVDTRTEKLIQDSMDKLTQGRTSFVIAHRLSTIKNADLILAMKDGDIVEKGTHDELLQKGGFYAGLYNSQFSEEEAV